MKIHPVGPIGLCLIIVGLIAVGCAHKRSARAETKREVVVARVPPVRPPLSPVEKAFTPEQRQWIAVYQGFVNRLSGRVGIPADSPISEIRPHLAKYFEVPADTPLEVLVQHPKAKRTLTEERRAGIVSAFELPSGTGWIKIEETLREAARRFDELRQVVRQ